MGDILSGTTGGAEPPWLWPRAAYIHVPFCAYHCGYCDFAVVAGRDDRIDDYLSALAAELSTLGTPTPVQTLFLGGGTPTHLTPAQLGRLLTTINHWLPSSPGRVEAPFPLAPVLRGEGLGVRGCGRLEEPPHPRPLSPEYRGEGERVDLSPIVVGSGQTDGPRHAPSVAVEFSVEANPDTLTADKVAVLADHGVTRVSLGAQSFHPKLLQTLDRAHEPAEIPRAVETVRRRIGQVSLDLIFGVPGQTENEWNDDLRRALALEPDHVSTYGLTYEKGTPLWKRRRRGELVPLNEDAELSLYTTAIDTLESAGFEHYEISNFARPGKRCRHNETYWANEAYFGFGVGAARYVRGRREINTRDLNAYISKAQSGEPCAFQSEELNAAERAKETMAVQLRRCDGIDRAAFRRQTGYDLDVTAGTALARLVAQGFLNDDGQRVRLTRQGKYVADAIIERLL